MDIITLDVADSLYREQAAEIDDINDTHAMPAADAGSHVAPTRRHAAGSAAKRRGRRRQLR